jgi:hypothetical protein
MTTEDAARLWAWYKAGGMAQVAAFQHARDVSKFNPAATPPWTDYRTRLIENGRSIAEAYVIEQIHQPSPEFRLGIVASPLHKLCNQLQQGSPNGAKVPPAAVLHALKEAGWIDLGMVKSTDYQTKKNLWVREDMVKTYSKSELRRMVEQAPEQGLKLGKS